MPVRGSSRKNGRTRREMKFRNTPSGQRAYPPPSDPAKRSQRDFEVRDASLEVVIETRHRGRHTGQHRRCRLIPKLGAATLAPGTRSDQ